MLILTKNLANNFNRNGYKMLGLTKNTTQQSFLYDNLDEVLNHKHSLYKLSNLFPWDLVEKEFSDKYSVNGRPSKTIRLMVSLLLLKHMYNQGDETVVSSWVENPYWQYFSGMKTFNWELPCDPSDLVHFRKRIGEEGIEYIFSISIGLHGKSATEPDVVIDTTVQEKNITYPTDSKLYVKIIKRCWKITKKFDLSYRQSYRREIKALIRDLRFRNNPKNKKKAYKAQRRLKTIAGRLLREIKRNLSAQDLEKSSSELTLFEKVLNQKRSDKNKIYSLHEPSAYCMSKGKEHKKYEYGSKVSIVQTKNSGIIVGALNFKENIFDGHTLPDVLLQTERLTNIKRQRALCDRGYRGKKFVNGVEIHVPGKAKKNDSKYKRFCARKRFRRRAAIEPIIGHLKSDNRLSRNFYKGVFGDTINVMLAAAAFNLKKLLRKLLFCLNIYKNIFCRIRLSDILILNCWNWKYYNLQLMTF